MCSFLVLCFIFALPLLWAIWNRNIQFSQKQKSTLSWKEKSLVSKETTFPNEICMFVLWSWDARIQCVLQFGQSPFLVLNLVFQECVFSDYTVQFLPDSCVSLQRFFHLAQLYLCSVCGGIQFTSEKVIHNINSSGQLRFQGVIPFRF